MGVSHLHTPRLNNISVYDPKVYGNGIVNFIGIDSADAVKFIPAGRHTMSTICPLNNNAHNKIIGAGRMWDGFYGFFSSTPTGTAEGFTQLVFTASSGADIFEDATPDAGYYNALTIRDLQISVDDMAQNNPVFNLIREEYVELCGIGLDTYNSTLHTGYIAYITGSAKVDIIDVDVFGFCESSSANEDAMFWIRQAEMLNIDRLHVNGQSAKHYPTAEIRLDEVSMANINDSYFNYIGNVNKSTVLVQMDAGLTTDYKYVCNINNLRLGTMSFTTSQTGLFSATDAKAEIVIQGIYTGFATTSNRIRMNNNSYVGALLIRGDVCGTTASTKVPYGKKDSPFDTTNNLISPSPSGAASATAPVASTNYVCELRNANLIARGGAGVVVTHSGIAEYYDTSGISYHLNVGETISFGPFSTAPTVSVYFER